MKKTALIAIVGLSLVGCSNIGNLDQGQVKYTPGVPPWKETDPSKKGPGAAPGGGGPGATPPAANNAPGANSAAPPPGGGPPGMTAPKRGM